MKTTKNRLLTTAAAAGVLFSLAAHAAPCPDEHGDSAATAANFTVNADGTVLDRKARLMWKRCNEGLSGPACASGGATNMSWAEAMRAARRSTFAGYSDWRLPTKHELERLVHPPCIAPAIDRALFPNTAPDWTWTASTVDGKASAAWFVNFYGGDSVVTDKRDDELVVRLVRDASLTPSRTPSKAPQ